MSTSVTHFRRLRLDFLFSSWRNPPEALSQLEMTVAFTPFWKPTLTCQPPSWTVSARTLRLATGDLPLLIAGRCLRSTHVCCPVLSQAMASFFSFLSSRLCATYRLGSHMEAAKNWGTNLFCSALQISLASGLPFGWRPALLLAREKHGICMAWHCMAMGGLAVKADDSGGFLLSALAVGGGITNWED